MSISTHTYAPLGAHRYCWLCLALLIVVGNPVLAHEPFFDPPSHPLFDPPTYSCEPDEILLISTRGIGTRCDSETIKTGLRCFRHVEDVAGATWKTSDWRRLLSDIPGRPTVVYVHGNRVSGGQDREQGLQVYRSLKRDGELSCPIRFVIWSWPSAPIPGPIKDYVVKAQRTTPAAWQLAWVIDKLPVETPISLVGYSYGTRVVGGAAHLLAGGSLGQLTLADRVHPQRPPVRAALIAAAFDADWIQPGNIYGRSFVGFERLVLATNRLDPAMRFYHLSNGRGKMNALGKFGVHQPQTLGRFLARLEHVDFSSDVGRSHAIADYLASSQAMSSIWRVLIPAGDLRPLRAAPTDEVAALRRQ